MGLDFNLTNGQTPLDEEEIEGLKLKTVTTQSELDEFEQLNIEKAVEWLIHSNLNTDKILSEKFIKDLHKKMYGEVWKWAGEFRKTNKNIGVHWSQISVELKKLIDDTKYWLEHKTYPPAEIAIRFKHRIVSIHCFANGNGRHSRLMADVIMESVFNLPAFSWSQSKMKNPDVVRKNYITTLKKADQGDLFPLLEFAQN